MPLPDYESFRIPEGRYVFQVTEEAEKRRLTGKKEQEFVAVKFTFKATAGDEEYQHRESFLPWEDRYKDLLIALGAEPDEKGNVSGRSINEVGKTFTADIVHEEDSKDPKKTWARITNIQIASPQTVEEEDIPF